MVAGRTIPEAQRSGIKSTLKNELKTASPDAVFSLACATITFYK
jgi:hypothetical protein